MMDEAGVDRVVIVPPGVNERNDYALEAVRRYPGRFAVMGQFPPGDRSNEKLIPGWHRQPGMVGLRWSMFYYDQPVELPKGTYDWIWPVAEKAGVPVSLQAGLFLSKFRWIAETHPRLPLIISNNTTPSA